MNSLTNVTTGIRHDLFAAIQYEKRQGKKGDVIGLQLDAQFVFKWLVKEAWEHYAASIPNANKAKFFTSEDLFNDAERWARLDKPFHIAIGRCTAFFMRKKMLPLSCINPHATDAKLYMVIGQ